MGSPRRPRKSAGRRPARGRRRRPAARAGTPGLARALTRREMQSLRAELGKPRSARPGRWNVDPRDAQRSLAQLVLSLVEFLRKLMERQAIRRMEARTLTQAQAEDIGLALMRLEQTVHELARGFGLDPADLSLDLGPLGRLH